LPVSLANLKEPLAGFIAIGAYLLQWELYSIWLPQQLPEGFLSRLCLESVRCAYQQCKVPQPLLHCATKTTTEVQEDFTHAVHSQLLKWQPVFTVLWVCVQC